MCITVNHAALSKTKILSLPIPNGNHFIAYSNSVKNLSGKPNAMILAIPGKTKSSWFHNTEKYKDFLTEIAEKATIEHWIGSKSRGLKSKGVTLSFEQFELGMYTIGLADSFDGAEDFINSLPDNKKPEVGEELKNFFKTEYAGWSFAVCCFDSTKAIDAQPIAFEYTPFNKDFLYFPSLDAHDGEAPDLTKSVRTDHTIIFEHTGYRNVEQTYYMESIKLDAPVPEFLQERKYRLAHMNGLAKNGDTFIKISEMNDINFITDPKMYRIPPVPYEPKADVYEYKLNHSKGPIYVTLEEGENFSIKIEGPISVVSKAIGGIGSENNAEQTVVVTEAHLKTEASRIYAIMEISRLCQEDLIKRLTSVAPMTKIR
jgi:hypothetical protein